jgi:hypothetical protein
MDGKQYPIALNLEIWTGYGYFLELECPDMGIYSVYWVPEKKLDAVLETIAKQLEDLEPLAGGKILLDETKKKHKKNEGLTE